MIATLRRPGRFPINLRSRGGGQTASKTRLEASHLLFRPLYFLQKHLKHPSFLFFSPLSVSEKLPRDVYQKEVDFQSITCASNWLRTRVEMRDASLSANYRQASGRPYRADECKSALFLAVCFTFGRKVQPLVQKLVFWKNKTIKATAK